MTKKVPPIQIAQIASVEQAIVEVVKKAVVDTLINAELPACKLHMHKINEVEDLSKKLSLIIIGNGNPENGLVFKMAQTHDDVVRLVDASKTRSAREWSLMLIGIGLIATSVWQIIVK